MKPCAVENRSGPPVQTRRRKVFRTEVRQYFQSEVAEEKLHQLMNAAGRSDSIDSVAAPEFVNRWGVTQFECGAGKSIAGFNGHLCSAAIVCKTTQLVRSVVQDDALRHIDLHPKGVASSRTPFPPYCRETLNGTSFSSVLGRISTRSSPGVCETPLVSALEVSRSRK